MGTTIRILIVDDHSLFREGLRSVIDDEQGFEVVGQAADGRTALERFVALGPDITLLDVHFPKESGLDILQEIRKKRPSARVLMISTFAYAEDVFQALQFGAKGYVLKDVGAVELLAAVRIVHEGRLYVPEWAGHQLAERAGAGELSDREREILQLLAEGCANKQIAARLGISQGTVKAHLNHAFEKMGVSDRTQALLVALRRGIVHLD